MLQYLGLYQVLVQPFIIFAIETTIIGYMELNKRLNYKSLVELCKEYKEDIKARKKLTGVLGNRKVRYVNQEGLFGYTQFGDFYFTSMGVMMLITTDFDLTWYHTPDEMCDTLYSTVPVFFAGFETGFKDDTGRDIYTGDVVKLTRNSGEYTLMANQIYWCKYPSLRADNHEIEFQEGDRFHIVGNVFYDILAEHLEIYDLWYYVGHNSIFIYPHTEDQLNEELEKMARAPFFRERPKKRTKHPLMYDETIRGYEPKPEDMLILFCSGPDDNIDPDDESTFPLVYADYLPKGSESLHSLCIPIDLFKPDLQELKKDVDDILERAHYSIEHNFIVLDYERSIGNMKVSKALDELFRPVYDYKLHNVILPFRMLNESFW